MKEVARRAAAEVVAARAESDRQDEEASHPPSEPEPADDHPHDATSDPPGDPTSDPSGDDGDKGLDSPTVVG